MGAQFTKTWELKNVGTCTWTTNYALLFSSGNQMGGLSPSPLISNVVPGGTVNVSVNLTAPSNGGKFVGFWKLEDAGGSPFGVGLDGQHSFWVEIGVPGATATPTLISTSPPAGTPVPTQTSTLPSGTQVPTLTSTPPSETPGPPPTP